MVLSWLLEDSFVDQVMLNYLINLGEVTSNEISIFIVEVDEGILKLSVVAHPVVQ